MVVFYCEFTFNCNLSFLDLLDRVVLPFKDQTSAKKLIKNVHGTIPQDLLKCFEVLKKCRNKFDCLLYEMLHIRTLKPNLNVQSDSIRAKVFV